MITKLDIENILKNLASRGDLYLCESQFQFDLAKEISRRFKKSVIHLEFPSEIIGTNRFVYYDIVVQENTQYFVIELKYKTKEDEITYKGENYPLKNQAAQDLGRFDYLKDISRIEQWSILNPNRQFGGGVAIILTNDSSYWTRDGKNCNYEEFSLKDGLKIMAGKKNWKSGTTPASTGINRISGLTLRDNYSINWNGYCSGKKYEFKYLIEEIH